MPARHTLSWLTRLSLQARAGKAGSSTASRIRAPRPVKPARGGGRGSDSEEYTSHKAGGNLAGAPSDRSRRTRKSVPNYADPDELDEDDSDAPSSR